MIAPRPYADPRLAGVGLGFVLLACFALTGRGLGASGAFAAAAGMVATQAGAQNEWFRSYLAGSAWILVEVAGIVVGAALSARLAGRTRLLLGDAGRVAPGRLVAATGGGVLMGIGAALARGCTSGLALSGGAMLSAGAWLFMLALFAAGFAAAPLARKLWA